MEKNKTLIIGASEKPERYSNKAFHRLMNAGHELFLIGARKGGIDNVIIHDELIQTNEVDTVTLYLNPERQKEYEDYIISLKPRRVIFNPGTENKSFENRLEKENIEAIRNCTLVMLSLDIY